MFDADAYTARWRIEPKHLHVFAGVRPQHPTSMDKPQRSSNYGPVGSGHSAAANSGLLGFTIMPTSLTRVAGHRPRATFQPTVQKRVTPRLAVLRPVRVIRPLIGVREIPGPSVAIVSL